MPFVSTFHTVIILQSLPLPNEDFGRSDERFRISRRQLGPLFFDNLHFEHFDKNFNLDSWLELLSKWSKWRLSKKRGLVAEGCSECLFEALFKGVSTRFGLQIVETCFENAFWNVCPTVQNLRLGSIKLLQKIIASQNNQHIASHATIFCYHLAKFMLPKRRFWKAG